MHQCENMESGDLASPDPMARSHQFAQNFGHLRQFLYRLADLSHLGTGSCKTRKRRKPNEDYRYR